MRGWIGVDFDGTLCKDDADEPVPAMVQRIKDWLKQGYEVRIVTARCASVNNVLRHPKYVENQKACISAWTLKHIGVPLDATAEKDFNMLQLWDDRAVTVEKDTGRALAVTSRGNL